MPTDWADRAWVGLAVLLAGAAAWGVLWAWWGEAWKTRRARRSGGLRRCGRCWYDMVGVGGVEAGAGGFKCPECGWVAKDERGLKRPRRRWWVAAAAVVLLAPAWVAWEMPVVRREGWPRIMPTVVLAALWPMDLAEDVWKGEAWREICQRREEHVLPGLARWILARRTVAAWSREAPPGSVIGEFDLRGLAEDAEWFLPMPALSDVPCFPPRYGPRVWRDCADLEDVVKAVLTSGGSGTHDVGGGRTVELGDRLLVQASPETVECVGELIEALRATGERRRRPSGEWERVTAGQDLVEVGEWVVASLEWAESEWEGLGEDERRDDGVRRVLTSCVAPDEWVDNGGDQAVCMIAAGRVVVWGDAEVRRGVRDLLGAHHAAGPARPIVGWAGGVIMDVRDIVGKECERRGGGRWACMEELRRAVTECVAPDAWPDFAGDRAQLCGHEGRLVMCGDAEVLERAAEFVEAVRGAQNKRMTRLEAWSPRCLGDGEGQPEREYVLAWNVADVLRAMGYPEGRRPEPLASCTGTPIGRFPARSVWHWLQRSDPTCEESSRVVVFGDVAAFWTIRPGAVERVQGAVRRAEEGKASNGGGWGEF